MVLGKGSQKGEKHGLLPYPPSPSAIAWQSHLFYRFFSLSGAFLIFAVKEQKVLHLWCQVWAFGDHARLWHEYSKCHWFCRWIKKNRKPRALSLTFLMKAPKWLSWICIICLNLHFFQETNCDIFGDFLWKDWKIKKMILSGPGGKKNRQKERRLMKGFISKAQQKVIFHFPNEENFHFLIHFILNLSKAGSRRGSEISLQQSSNFFLVTFSSTFRHFSTNWEDK